MKIHSYLIAAACIGAMLIAPCVVFGQTERQETNSASLNLDDAYGDAFVNYLPYKPRPNKKVENAATPQPTPPMKKPDQQKVDVEWLQKNYPILERNAIDNPTRENVAAYAYVRRIIMDKAQRFQEVVTRVTNEDPLLNENNRVPYASTGAQAIRNANYLAQYQAARELAAVGGLLVFVDSECRFCAQQMPIVQSLKSEVGLESLVITLDGKAPKGYDGKVVADNGLWKKLGLRLTPSIVYVPRPKPYQTVTDPNQYLIIAQGFYALDELVKQIAFAGHKTQLLSKATQKDLDVWNRGVASTEDMANLKLDPNRPGDIKSAIEPLLLKQYQQ